MTYLPELEGACEAAKIAPFVMPYMQGRSVDIGSGPGKVWPSAIGIDLGSDNGRPWTDIAADIAKRPFILVGFTAFVLLTPLALTSFNRAIRWLGAKRWQWLHRLVYAVALLAVLHFFWMRAGKSNFAEVFVYASIVTALLLFRLRSLIGFR